MSGPRGLDPLSIFFAWKGHCGLSLERVPMRSNHLSVMPATSAGMTVEISTRALD
jgi:hypothetical protein